MQPSFKAPKEEPDEEEPAEEDTEEVEDTDEFLLFPNMRRAASKALTDLKLPEDNDSREEDDNDEVSDAGLGSGRNCDVTRFHSGTSSSLSLIQIGRAHV